MAKPLPIDGSLVEKLASIGCKTEEIADHFKCSTDTIQRRFAAELIKGRADLHMSLRRWQLEAARKGNVVMQIWLGKQYLKQRDKSDEELLLMKAANDAEAKQMTNARRLEIVQNLKAAKGKAG